MHWVSDLVELFIEKRQAHQTASKNTLKSYFKRTFSKERTSELVEIVRKDIDFSDELLEEVKHRLTMANVSKSDLEKGLLHIRSHSSKNKERSTFLVIYAAMFSVVLMLIKAGLLFNLVILVVAGAAFMTIAERAILNNSSQAIEELADMLDFINSNEYKT